ncbi:uncharacterized protein LOC134230865 [Saccostrea cucullata]|uniref:uncharacterized protein LOC134230865 n=1 Tax=Saccostrea cuccullata TaxID=36930 RepID=UPI002ED3ADDD
MNEGELRCILKCSSVNPELSTERNSVVSQTTNEQLCEDSSNEMITGEYGETGGEQSVMNEGKLRCILKCSSVNPELSTERNSVVSQTTNEQLCEDYSNEMITGEYGETGGEQSVMNEGKLRCILKCSSVNPELSTEKNSVVSQTTNEQLCEDSSNEMITGEYGETVGEQSVMNEGELRCILKCSSVNPELSTERNSVVSQTTNEQLCEDSSNEMITGEYGETGGEQSVMNEGKLRCILKCSSVNPELSTEKNSVVSQTTNEQLCEDSSNEMITGEYGETGGEQSVMNEGELRCILKCSSVNPELSTERNSVVSQTTNEQLCEDSSNELPGPLPKDGDLDDELAGKEDQSSSAADQPSSSTADQPSSSTADQPSCSDHEQSSNSDSEQPQYIRFKGCKRRWTDEEEEELLEAFGIQIKKKNECVHQSNPICTVKI